MALAQTQAPNRLRAFIALQAREICVSEATSKSAPVLIGAKQWHYINKKHWKVVCNLTILMDMSNLSVLMDLSKTLPCATLGIGPSRPHNLIGLAALFSRVCRSGTCSNPHFQIGSSVPASQHQGCAEPAQLQTEFRSSNNSHLFCRWKLLRAI